jgi:hypothetical protein
MAAHSKIDPSDGDDLTGFMVRRTVTKSCDVAAYGLIFCDLALSVHTNPKAVFFTMYDLYELKQARSHSLSSY